MNVAWENLPNPKRLSANTNGRDNWYPFYPGFSSDFASWILDALSSGEGVTVLDPWNGSGTTTTAAARREQSRVIGFDLNPAMVVIAKAKLLDPLDIPSLRPLARQIVKCASESKLFDNSEQDPLAHFFSVDAALTLRQLERACQKILVDVDDTAVSGPSTLVDEMSPIAAFMYVAIFRTVKHLLRELGGTNPVWTRLKIDGRTRRRPKSATVFNSFIDQVEQMIATDGPHNGPSPSGVPNVLLRTGSSTSLPLPDKSVDVVVSSPPYCTRVDYAVATLPELSVLRYRQETTFDALRRQLLGTTTVPKTCESVSELWGVTCGSFLEALKSHTSKASSGYYFKNHVAYFSQLYTSINELRRVTAPGGTVVLVVQDSHYKDLHNDLPKIIVEMARTCEFKLIASRNFRLTRLLSASNPRVRHYRSGQISATESVVVLSD